MIVIQACNIHQGGGAVLLKSILYCLDKKNITVKVFVDSRFQFESKKCIEVVKVKASVFSRFKIEVVLAQLSRKNKNLKILFFGNLPPLFRSNKNAVLFFQNLILLNKSNKIKFEIRTEIKHFIEKVWLKICLKNINTVYVQSESVKRHFLIKFPYANVRIMAFFDLLPVLGNSEDGVKYFVYVASGDPHKNHLNLIKAWIYLYESGVNLKLILTTSCFSNEAKKIFTQALSKGVDIEVKLNLSRKEIFKLYSSAKALVYPSLTESFGLPLLEAKLAGLPIIASELDYVRDLVDPVQTFDPNSDLSIARAVQRFLNINESGKTEIKSAADFVDMALLKQ